MVTQKKWHRSYSWQMTLSLGLSEPPCGIASNLSTGLLVLFGYHISSHDKTWTGQFLKICAINLFSNFGSFSFFHTMYSCKCLTRIFCAFLYHVIWSLGLFEISCKYYMYILCKLLGLVYCIEPFEQFVFFFTISVPRNIYITKKLLQEKCHDPSAKGWSFHFLSVFFHTR